MLLTQLQRHVCEHHVSAIRHYYPKEGAEVVGLGIPLFAPERTNALF